MTQEIIRNRITSRSPIEAQALKGVRVVRRLTVEYEKYVWRGLGKQAIQVKAYEIGSNEVSKVNADLPGSVDLAKVMTILLEMTGCEVELGEFVARSLEILEVRQMEDKVRIYKEGTTRDGEDLYKVRPPARPLPRRGPVDIGIGYPVSRPGTPQVEDSDGGDGDRW